MYSFFLMVKDFLLRANFHWYIIFYLIILLRWVVIFFHAKRYRHFKYDGKIDFFSTVIIPVVDEPIDVFSKVLTKIMDQTPNEIIVVINGPKNQKLMDACQEVFTNHSELIHKVIYTPIAGKRNAIREGLEHSDPRSDITILVDSDTIWTKGTLIELMKPFKCDDRIGGVTTRQKIFDPKRNLITLFANLLEEIRSEGSMKAMSATKKVGCLPGRTIAFRTSILLDALEEFLTEKFLGFHKEVSDDRSLTNLTLKKGYYTVMQDTSVVYTDAPTRWKKFVRQQLRWAEGSQYNNLRMTPWMARHAPLMLFIYWTDMLLPFTLLATYLNAIICYLLNSFGFYVATVPFVESFWMTAIYIIFGAMFGFGIRNTKVLSHQPFYVTLLVPVFIFILTFIMVPVRIIGLMRCADDLSWGTRQLGEQPQTND